MDFGKAVKFATSGLCGSCDPVAEHCCHWQNFADGKLLPFEFKNF
jgi:adenine-specific DNA glycosylase